ncbi:hypothetical protein [Photobacterium marinum]|nr:hypothetical protein [Photobacterium marinum]
MDNKLQQLLKPYAEYEAQRAAEEAYKAYAFSINQKDQIEQLPPTNHKLTELSNEQIKLVHKWLYKEYSKLSDSKSLYNSRYICCGIPLKKIKKEQYPKLIACNILSDVYDFFKRLDVKPVLMHGSEYKAKVNIAKYYGCSIGQVDEIAWIKRPKNAHYTIVCMIENKFRNEIDKYYGVADIEIVARKAKQEAEAITRKVDNQ